MSENENINPKAVEMKNMSTIVIDDSKNKLIKRSTQNFSTNYLSLNEQLRLILKKHFTIYSRSLGVLIFMFLSPIFFLALLQFLQIVSDQYNSIVITKERPVLDLNTISLKCEEEPCISIGISVLVK
jgi:hypothetical protein